MFSANTSQVSGDKLFVEDVFSTYLYTGNGGTQTITNGIDLAGKGGLVWSKRRSTADWHTFFDTARTLGYALYSNTTGAETLETNSISSFNSTGYSFGSGNALNRNAERFASWTFRKAPKFFDVVTYTGNSSNRSINHSLGVAPGFIIIKRTDTTSDWWCYHRNVSFSGSPGAIALNQSAAADAYSFFPTAPTSTTFDLSTDSRVNANGGTYVAYLFAHDTTSDGIIQCGSFTLSGSPATVNLGWEPQWVMIKSTSSADDWWMYDNMRGMAMTDSAYLRANVAFGEGNWGTSAITPTPTGFTVPTAVHAAGTYIYIAIRRGPMKTPTSGTSVFSPVSQAGGGTITTNFPVDLVLTAQNTLVGDKYSFDRLRGSVSTSSKYLITNKTDAEATVGAGFGLDNNLGYKDNGIFSASYNAIYWNFRRAPSFFDEVCYTGTGANRTVNHNLGVAPELMIIKCRSASGVNSTWVTYAAPIWGTGIGGFSGFDLLRVNATAAANMPNSILNSTQPTGTVFSLGTDANANGSGLTYVAYLFASCPGVSKVGSYTGNGTTQTINCGFTSGARFVLIKRTDSTGDWYVWDTARGMTALTDPYLLMNSTAAETSTLGAVTTTSVGFSVNASVLAAINTSGASYIFLAIA